LPAKLDVTLKLTLFFPRAKFNDFSLKYSRNGGKEHTNWSLVNRRVFAYEYPSSFPLSIVGIAGSLSALDTIPSFIPPIEVSAFNNGLGEGEGPGDVSLDFIRLDSASNFASSEA
jgi:hypothetical protein